MSLSAGSIIARASSGSRSSISSVEPRISANSAVTVLRSPSMASEVSVCAGWRTIPNAEAAAGNFAGGFTARAAPQSAQNFELVVFSTPQFGQRSARWLPHSAQNRLPGKLSVPHFEQRMSHSIVVLSRQVVEQCLGVFQVGGVETFGEPAIYLTEHRACLVA